MAGRRNIWHALDVNRYRVGAHTRHRLIYHLVWIPKYRKRILIGKVAVRLRQLMYQACEVRGWWVHELSIKPDHVHVLVQAGPGDSVAEVVKTFKGGTAIMLKRELPELEEWLWGDSLWADGYFAETVGSAQEDVVRRYIREQRGPSMPSSTSPGL